MTKHSIRRLSSHEIDFATKLLADWPFKPYVGYSKWSQERLTSLCLARAGEKLRSHQTCTWILESDNSIIGFAALTKLSWDSAMLGYPAARIDYFVATGSYSQQCETKQTLLRELFDFSVASDTKHLSIRVDASDLSSIHVLEQAGFITVDGILTYGMEFDREWEPITSGSIRTRLAGPPDMEAVMALARSAFKGTRFHADPAVDAYRADEIYTEWVRNSFLGLEADAIMVAEDDHSLVGFVTCKLLPDTKVHLDKLVGVIVLIATARNARNKKVARYCISSALEWFRQNGADIVEVGTQLGNIAASRLYQTSGFHLVGSSLSLRILPHA